MVNPEGVFFYSHPLQDQMWAGYRRRHGAETPQPAVKKEEKEPEKEAPKEDRPPHPQHRAVNPHPKGCDCFSCEYTAL